MEFSPKEYFIIGLLIGIVIGVCVLFVGMVLLEK